MVNKTRAPFRPLLFTFVILTGLFIAGRNMLAKWNLDQDVLIMGNLILAIVTLVSFLVLHRAIQSSNPQAFVRAMYVSFIVKFFVVAIAAYVYVMVAKKSVNKPSLILCMVLYVVYTFLEVYILTKLLKRKKNA